uniref:Secreted protein n=1 Tax=Ixodes scapularis TaxID=6945 RepID=A0A1S4LGG5_IXOSC
MQPSAISLFICFYCDSRLAIFSISTLSVSCSSTTFTSPSSFFVFSFLAMRIRCSILSSHSFLHSSNQNCYISPFFKSSTCISTLAHFTSSKFSSPFSSSTCVSGTTHFSHLYLSSPFSSSKLATTSPSLFLEPTSIFSQERQVKTLSPCVGFPVKLCLLQKNPTLKFFPLYDAP